MTTTGVSPLPNEPDVHLSIVLRGMRFDFAACITAALLFIQDHQQRRYVEAVGVSAIGADELPRLPNERLYIEP